VSLLRFFYFFWLNKSRLWEVCRATAAAPTYFPPASVRSVDGKIKGTLIDGGAVQNNPVSFSHLHSGGLHVLAWQH
jgi:patatin-like phospholipase/acyl hydrolase